jgi:hypothetical protein
VSVPAPDVLRQLGALATIVVGVVHLQQYADLIHDVPTIGVLFLLDGAGAGVVAILLATRRAPLGAVGGIALSAGAIVSIAISMSAGGLFGYQEPTLRAAVLVAIAAEAVAVALLLAYLVTRRPATRAIRRRGAANADWPSCHARGRSRCHVSSSSRSPSAVDVVARSARPRLGGLSGTATPWSSATGFRRRFHRCRRRGQDQIQGAR